MNRGILTSVMFVCGAGSSGTCRGCWRSAANALWMVFLVSVGVRPIATPVRYSSWRVGWSGRCPDATSSASAAPDLNNWWLRDPSPVLARVCNRTLFVDGIPEGVRPRRGFVPGGFPIPIGVVGHDSSPPSPSRSVTPIGTSRHRMSSACRPRFRVRSTAWTAECSDKNSRR
jgi:hypothetical protein